MDLYCIVKVCRHPLLINRSDLAYSKARPEPSLTRFRMIWKPIPYKDQYQTSLMLRKVEAANVSECSRKFRSQHTWLYTVVHVKTI